MKYMATQQKTIILSTMGEFYARDQEDPDVELRGGHLKELRDSQPRISSYYTHRYEYFGFFISME